MSRFDWRDRNEDRRAWRPEDSEREDFGQADYSRDYAYDPETRSGYRRDEQMARGEDYGQADYSRDWAYDRARGRPYRRDAEEGREADARYADYRDRDPDRDADRDRYRGERRESRSWTDRAGGLFAGRGEAGERRPERRRGPSDRVLWAVIVERLEEQRGLDLRDVEVVVEDAEVTLNGTVRRKDDKRRIEDVADVEGVRNVQNNLRVRDRGHWSLF